VRRTTDASKVPAPKSYTTTHDPLGISAPLVSANVDAAATGSGTSVGASIPASRAASMSTARRVEAQAAGYVSATAPGGPVTEQHRTVIDSALRMRLEALRPNARGVYRLAADE
jgi:hypothetical protein